MRKTAFTREEAVDLERLWKQYKASLDRAMKAVATDGMDSPAFFEAHKENTEAYRKIQELLGTIGQHRME